MAIQMRRGQASQFDPSKMLPGEFAVVLSGDATATDGRVVYMCFAAGSVKRLATFEDMVAFLTNAEAELAASFTEDVTAATAAANTAATNANTKAQLADEKATAANAAAADATAAAAEARGAVRPDMALYMDYDTVGNIQYISLVDANE